jgi:capsular exopolysaccharide synthesis family protein
MAMGTEAPVSLGLERARRERCLPQIERRVVVDSGETHPGEEKLRHLSHRLHHLRQARRLRTLVVTSGVPEEGKTVVATNLALTLANADSRVLLIDGDMRRPSIQSMLGVELGPGLSGCIAGNADPADCLRRLEPSGLYFLDAGGPVANPVELVQKAQFQELLKICAANFDWVIIDTPPVIPFADAHFIASVSDAVLLVARAGVTRPAEFERAVRSLKGAYVAGTVLNSYDEPEERSYYAHYGREGRGVKGKE